MNKEIIKDSFNEDELDLLFTYHGKNLEKVFTVSTENIFRILQRHPHFKDRIRTNVFNNRIEFKDWETNKFEERKDHTGIIIQTELSMCFLFLQKVSRQMVEDAFMKVAMVNRYDEAKDFLENITWDKTERLATWLHTAYGTPDDVYHRAVGTNWMVGLASRMYYPGSKFDNVLVLEGEQGCGKSESFAVLAGERWHMETTMSMDKKDFFEALLGKIIVEFSEGETMTRASIEKMKAVITTKVDRFRVSYGRVAEDFPRRCVFAMTTNKSQYLIDETGARRWLPIRVEKKMVDLQWIRENREQLFAEAFHLLKEGHKFWEFPEEETRAQQELRKERNPNEPKVAEYIFDNMPTIKTEGLTVNEIYENVFYKGFPNKPITRYDEMVIAGILRNIGFEKDRRMINGVRKMVWFPTDKYENTSLIEDSLQRAGVDFAKF